MYLGAKIKKLKKSLIPARTTTYREARAYHFVDFRSNHACSHLLGGLCTARPPAVIPVKTGIHIPHGIELPIWLLFCLLTDQSHVVSCKDTAAARSSLE